MNVVIYARYSSHNQSEQSIEGQTAACYEFAQRNNYNIVAEYIDRALSGTSDNRPEFQRMIEESARKHFQGVLVYQLDRFARNRFDSATYKAKLKKNGCRVLSARENISDDASGILVEGLLESMAEYYSAELSQKIKRGMNINAQKRLCTGGAVALGYKVNSQKEFEIDEPAAAVVVKIFELYSTGHTVTEIGEYLNAQQLKTSKGVPFNKNSLTSMLRNKRYVGYYTYNGQELKDGMPRIVSDELFGKVAEILQKNKKAPARSRAVEEYLLTTKLFCGHCRDMMTGTSGTSKAGKLYKYYTCNNVKKKLCSKKKVRKDYIETLVIKECRKLLTNENIARIASEVVSLLEREKDNSNEKRLIKLLKENEKQRNNLFDSLRICDIDSVKKGIFAEIGKMDIAYRELENQIALEQVGQINVTIPQIKFFLSELKKGNIDELRYRKTLISVFVNSIYLYDDKITLIFNSSKEPVTVDVALLDDIAESNESAKCSFISELAPPIQYCTNTHYCKGGFAVTLWLQ